MRDSIREEEDCDINLFAFALDDDPSSEDLEVEATLSDTPGRDKGTDIPEAGKPQCVPEAPCKPEFRSILLSSVRTDGVTQTRAAMNDEVVNEYAEKMAGGAEFPAIVVFYNDPTYWLADGFHRTEAIGKLGWTNVRAEIHRGGREDALRYSLGANAVHGLRRTNADKRNAVKIALSEFPEQSDRDLAKLCAVGHQLVGDVRKQVDESSTSTSEFRIGRDGKKHPAVRKSRTEVINAPVEVTPAGDDLNEETTGENNRTRVNSVEEEGANREGLQGDNMDGELPAGEGLVTENTVSDDRTGGTSEQVRSESTGVEITPEISPSEDGADIKDDSCGTADTAESIPASLPGQPGISQPAGADAPASKASGVLFQFANGRVFRESDWYDGLIATKSLRDRLNYHQKRFEGDPANDGNTVAWRQMMLTATCSGINAAFSIDPKSWEVEQMAEILDEVGDLLRETLTRVETARAAFHPLEECKSGDEPEEGGTDPDCLSQGACAPHET